MYVDEVPPENRCLASSRSFRFLKFPVRQFLQPRPWSLLSGRLPSSLCLFWFFTRSWSSIFDAESNAPGGHRVSLRGLGGVVRSDSLLRPLSGQ